MQHVSVEGRKFKTNSLVFLQLKHSAAAASMVITQNLREYAEKSV